MFRFETYHKNVIYHSQGLKTPLYFDLIVKGLTMKKILRTVLASTLALGAIVPLTITPASAVPHCPAGATCLYDDIWFGGRHQTYYNHEVSWIGDYMNDRTSSYVLGAATDDDHPYHLFYQHINYRGPNFFDRKGRAHSDLRGVYFPGGGNWSDEISSHQHATR